MLPAFGCTERQVFVHLAPGQEAVPVTLPFNARGLMNPLWEPGSNRLAVDYVDDAGLRHCVVGRPGSGAQWQRIPPIVEQWHDDNWECTAGVEWAPGGERLLVRIFAFTGWEFVRVINFPADGDPLPEHAIESGPPDKLQIRWSPDGKRVAMISTGDRWVKNSASTRVTVHVLGDDSKVSGRSVRLPEGLCPVSIDW